MDCMITYQKQNGDIIFRPRKCVYDRTIGQETSMGWKILDIHYRYNGNYYKYDDFWKLIHKENTKHKKIARYLIKKLKKYA